jgi:hypothetical protein
MHSLQKAILELCVRRNSVIGDLNILKDGEVKVLFHDWPLYPLFQQLIGKATITLHFSICKGGLGE